MNEKSHTWDNINNNYINVCLNTRTALKTINHVGHNTFESLFDFEIYQVDYDKDCHKGSL